MSIGCDVDGGEPAKSAESEGMIGASNDGTRSGDGAAPADPVDGGLGLSPAPALAPPPIIRPQSRLPPDGSAGAGDGAIDEGDAGQIDAGQLDAGQLDAGVADSGTVDAGVVDSGTADAGQIDAGQLDAGVVDSGTADAGQIDAGQLDAGAGDSGTVDAGDADSGPEDAGQLDADMGGDDCPRGACMPGGQCVDGDQDWSCDCDPGWAGSGTQACAPEPRCDDPFPVTTAGDGRDPVWFGNGSNSGIALWTSPRAAGTSGAGLNYARYDDTNGFSAPVQLMAGNGGNTTAAVDPNGNILMAWEVIGSGSRELWADFYDVERSGWRGATLLTTYPGSPLLLAFAPDGTGILVQVSTAGGSARPHARHYTPGTNTWSGAVDLASVTNQNAVAGSYRIAADETQVIVAWLQAPATGGGQQLWINHYIDGAWLRAPVAPGGALNTASISLVAAHGLAAVAYQDYLNPDQRLFVRRYTDGAWSADREQIFTGDRIIREIRPALAPDGLLHVTWQMDVAPSVAWTTHWTAARPGEAWSAAIQVGVASSGREDDLLAAADPDGNVRIVFDLNEHIRTNLYDADSATWTLPPQFIEQVDDVVTGFANRPALGNLGLERWMTLWTYSDPNVPNTSTLWAALCH